MSLAHEVCQFLCDVLLNLDLHCEFFIDNTTKRLDYGTLCEISQQFRESFRQEKFKFWHLAVGWTLHMLRLYLLDKVSEPKNLHYSRVIQISPKWQNWLFATFMARFRIFWKMMFGKMQKFFWYDHSNACQKCPKVLLHNAPMWNGAKQKIQFFFSFFNNITIFCSLNLMGA